MDGQRGHGMRHEGTTSCVGTRSQTALTRTCAGLARGPPDFGRTSPVPLPNPAPRSS